MYVRAPFLIYMQNVKGLWRGVGEHFSVHARKESALIIAFVSGSSGSEIRSAGLRGCGEGWASHFSVHARKESALIIEFVSESHVAELIQHQKVIDYTATYKWATTAIFGLLRPSTRISLGHTPPHGQTPSGPHTAAHGPALTSRACCAEPNGRDSIAGSNTRVVDAGTS